MREMGKELGMGAGRRAAAPDVLTFVGGNGTAPETPWDDEEQTESSSTTNISAPKIDGRARGARQIYHDLDRLFSSLTLFSASLDRALTRAAAARGEEVGGDRGGDDLGGPTDRVDEWEVEQPMEEAKRQLEAISEAITGGTGQRRKEYRTHSCSF